MNLGKATSLSAHSRFEGIVIKKMQVAVQTMGEIKAGKTPVSQNSSCLWAFPRLSACGCNLTRFFSQFDYEKIFFFRFNDKKIFFPRHLLLKLGLKWNWNEIGIGNWNFRELLLKYECGGKWAFALARLQPWASLSHHLSGLAVHNAIVTFWHLRAQSAWAAGSIVSLKWTVAWECSLGLK